jgi:hypothetical protein
MSVNSKKTAKKCTTSVVQSETPVQRYAGSMPTVATFAGLPLLRRSNAVVKGGIDYLDNDKKIQNGFSEGLSVTTAYMNKLGTSWYNALKGNGIGNWSPELQADIVAIVHNTTKEERIQELKALRDLCSLDSTATLKFDVFYLLESKFRTQRVHYETKVLNEFLKRSPDNMLMKNVLSRVAKKRIRDKTGPWWIVDQNVQNKYGTLEKQKSMQIYDDDQNGYVRLQRWCFNACEKPKSMMVRDDEQNRESTISTNIQLFDTEELKRKFLEALQTEMTDLAGDTYTNWALVGQNFQNALKIAEDFVENEVVNNFELAMEKSGLVLAGSYDKFESLQVFRSAISNELESTTADQFELDHSNVDAQLFKTALKQCVQDYEKFFKESDQIFLYERVGFSWEAWKARGSVPEKTIDPTIEEINLSDNFFPYVNVHKEKYEILRKFWNNLELSIAMQNGSMQKRNSGHEFTKIVPSDSVKKIPYTDESIYEMLTTKNSEFEFKMSPMTLDADIERKRMFLAHLKFLKRVMQTFYIKPYWMHSVDHKTDEYIWLLYRKVCGCLAVIYWVRTGQLVRYQNYDSKFDDDPGKYNHLIRLFEENLMQLQIEFGAWEDQFKTNNGLTDIISDPAARCGQLQAGREGKFHVLQGSQTPLPLQNPEDLDVTPTQNIDVPISSASYDHSRNTFDNLQLDGYCQSLSRYYHKTIHRIQQIFGADTSVVVGAIISYTSAHAALTTGKELVVKNEEKMGQFRAFSRLMVFSALIYVCKGVAKSCMDRFRKDNTSVLFEINSASDEDGLQAHNVLIKLVPKSIWNGTIVQNVWPDFKKKINDLISELGANKKINYRFDDDEKYFYFFDIDQIENLDRRIRAKFHNTRIYCDEMQKDVLFIHDNEKKMTEDLEDKITEEILSQQPTTSPKAKTCQEIKTTLESIRPDIKKLLAQRRSAGPTLYC